MALSFSVIDTTMTPLWDFGWFDLTRFKVDGPATERQDCNHVLTEFLRAPISQRSFCDPGQWGESIQRHGPFLCDRLAAEWFRPITTEQLEDRIRAALDDPEFTVPPNNEQRQPVEGWAAAVKGRGDDAFVLDAPDLAEIKVDWAFVWTVYREFATVSPDREELAIGVIGFD
ncbi:protein of unknown function [Nitrospira defluvii]|jgi:hypothetical protein|uniref:Uncharacterized protein n=1 Tax=Nitrospira defluvii TaxID=330214 RepID=D8PHA0_9BACT|nr:protein of unknown function [Nitrospira defluvii]